MHIYLEKRKVPQVSVLILRKNGCSVRHMFCSIFVPFSVAKVLEKHVESSSYLLLVFFKENVHMGNLLNGCFCYSYLHELSQADILSELLFPLWALDCGCSKLIIANYVFTGYFI